MQNLNINNTINSNNYNDNFQKDIENISVSNTNPQAQKKPQTIKIKCKITHTPLDILIFSSDSFDIIFFL